MSLYVSGILQMRSATEYENRYGALVAAFPPWNAFIIPFVPCYVLMKDTKKLNRLLFHIAYFPVAVCAFSVFIVLGLLAIPFAYFKCLGIRVY